MLKCTAMTADDMSRMIKRRIADIGEPEPLSPCSFRVNDKNAVVDMPNINPLLQKKANVKPLKLPKAKLGVVKTPKPFKATVQFA